MKTALLVILAAVLIGGGIWFLATSSSEYEVMVGDEVSELEAELAQLDARILSGELSPEAALVARTNIISRLDGINAQMNAAGKASLTPAQRKQLNDALQRLKRVLVTYSDTLNVVDTVAAADRRTGRSGGSLVNRFATTVASSEAVVAAEGEVETEASIETALDEITENAPETIDEVAAETDLPDNLLDDVGESIDDTATSSDEGEVESSEDTIEDEEAEGGATTTVEAELESDFEVQ